MKEAFEALDAAAADAGPKGPRAVLEASFRGWLEFFTNHRNAALVVLREAQAIDARFNEAREERRRSALTRFSARFRKFQELGLASAAVNPDLAAHFQLGVLDELLQSFV